MHVLVTANIAISHMSMQEFVYYPDFISIDNISKSKIAESSASTILRNLQTFSIAVILNYTPSNSA